MDLKQKFKTAKNKLDENAYKIVAVTSTVSGFVALGIALHYKNKFEVAESGRLEHRRNLNWMYVHVKDGPKKLSYDDNHFYIDPLTETEKD